MKKVYFILIYLVFWGYISGQSSTEYDVEFSRICLIDSIAPDNMVQFWRFTQANNPGQYTLDVTYDLSSAYIPTGTLVKCCSCLSAASDAGISFPNKPGNWFWKITAGILGFIGFAIFVFIVIMFWLGKQYQTKKMAARIACTLFILALGPYTQISAQSETRYDVEFSCICLVDSIGPGNVVQFYRFTQANNPGEYTVDVTYDLSSTYTPTGTVLGCNDYYLGDNPGGSGTVGTLAIWTGTNSLGNSSVTESGQIISSSLTGALKVPSGTDAEVPVWDDGQFRYNTTQGGFQGGSNGYYLPWADVDNFTQYRIPYSDGNRLISSGQFTYNGSQLGLGSGGVRIIANSGTPVSIGSSSTNNQYAGVAIGLGATFTGSDGVAIGYNSSSAGTGQSFGRQCTTVNESVGIGNNADATGSNGVSVGVSNIAGQNSTALGNNCSVAYQSIGIGNNSDVVNPAEDAIAIGNTAYVNAREGIAIGDGSRSSGIGSIAIGKGTYTTQPASIAFGNGSTTTAENELIIGSNDTLTTERGGFAVNNIYFGTGKNRRWFNQTSIGNGGSYTINGSGAYGTDYAGGNVTIAGGKGTGSGTPGYISFSTSTAGASSSTLQTLTERFRIDGYALYGYGYGSGTITGTPSIQSTSFTSGGKLIERKFAYAEMYCTDTNPDTITFTGGSTTPDQPTDLTAGELANFTYSAGRLTYTGAETAKFLVNTSVSFSFSEGSTDIEGWIYLDGAKVSKSEFHRKIGTGGDIGNSGQTCIVELATNSYIEIFFAPVAHTGDDDLIIENLNVNLVKI